MTRHAAFVTGASRGLGRAIALSMAKASLPIDIFLLGRDREALHGTKKLADSLSGDAHKVAVYPMQLDMAGQHFDAESARLFSPPTLPHPTRAYSSAFLFHNAGTLGPLAHVRDLAARPDAVRSAVSQDLSSVILMTGQFLSAFASDATLLTIVNISSIAAVQEFENWGVYCAVKSARDSLMRTVAAEEKALLEGRRRVRTLNYAPGPLDTAMQSQIRDAMPDTPFRQTYVDMHAEGKLVHPDESAARLMDILAGRRGEWKGLGEHVDYYDVA